MLEFTSNVAPFRYVRVDNTLAAVTFDINAPEIKNSCGQTLKSVAVGIVTPAGFGFGVADCSPSDEYNELIGRRVALSRAIIRFNFSRPQRKSIYDQLGL